MKHLNDISTYIREHPLFPVMVTMGWNLGYAVFNGILGLVYSSWWFVTLGAFYAGLGLMRLSAARSRGRRETVVMRHNGVAMIFFSVVLVGMMLLTIREKRNPVRNNVVMIGIAAYTTFLVVWTVRNMILAHRQRSCAMITLRNIACAGTIGSVLSLERAMLGTFGTGDTAAFNRVMEAATGAAAFILFIGIGIHMILTARQIEKEGNFKGNFN